MAGPDEEEGLFDRVSDAVDEVVDEVLAEGVEPESESPWERRARRLESWTAIILALAAVAATWASFQASRWSERQVDSQARSAIARSDANQAASRASGERIIDSQIWLSWLLAYKAERAERTAFFRERFSPALARAQVAWVAEAPPPAADGSRVAPPGTPMDLDIYRVPSDLEAERFSNKAEQELRDAGRYAATSTGFVQLAVLFALALFFAGIATKFGRPKVQAGLILAAIVVLAIATVQMLALPQAL